MSTDTTRLNEFLSGAIEAARVGAAELERWRGKFSVREKGRADLVTEADEASQKLVKAVLLKRFPDHLFIGEEESVGKSPGEVRPPADAPPAWVVDPLDGTANYAHDVPAYCVSIGLWHAGKAVVGVILDPRQNELFSAAVGLGAFLNGKPIRVSTVPDVAGGMISTGFPADYQKLGHTDWDWLEERIDRWLNLFRQDDFVGTVIDEDGRRLRDGKPLENRPVGNNGHMNYWRQVDVLRILEGLLVAAPAQPPRENAAAAPPASDGPAPPGETGERK